MGILHTLIHYCTNSIFRCGLSSKSCFSSSTPESTSTGRVIDKIKKVVLKLELHDGKDERKAMKAVSALSGIDSIAIDTKDKKLTVTGDVDPVTVAEKLRKLCHTEIVTVGPAKEDKKKDEPKKGDEKKKDPKAEWEQFMRDYYGRYPPAYSYPPAYPYYYRSAEEDPMGCVIC